MNVRPSTLPAGQNRSLFWPVIRTERDPAYFSEKFGATFHTEEVEGLGRFEVAALDLGGVVCTLTRSVDLGGKVVVDIPTNVPEPRQFVESAAMALGLGSDRTVVLDENFTKLHWELWREDDNGNRAMMARFLDESTAQACAQAFEHRGHRQRYWVQHAL